MFVDPDQLIQHSLLAAIQPGRVVIFGNTVPGLAQIIAQMIGNIFGFFHPEPIRVTDQLDRINLGVVIAERIQDVNNAPLLVVGHARLRVPNENGRSDFRVKLVKQRRAVLRQLHNDRTIVDLHVAAHQGFDRLLVGLGAHLFLLVVLLSKCLHYTYRHTVCQLVNSSSR